MSAAGQDSAERSSTDDKDFVAALEHAPLVESVLRRSGVTETETDASEALGLARVTLDPATAPDRLASGIANLLAEDSSTAEREARDAVQAAQQGATGPIDGVLRLLRLYFELRYAGWLPTMGKNRIVGQVTGGGTVSHGGGPSPTPADPRAFGSDPAGSGVTVGILDTTFRAHPALAGCYLASQADLLAPGATYEYAAGHSTFVAGLVHEQAPGATLRVRKVLGDDGTATSWDVASAIVEIGRTGIDLLNLSFVCYTADGKPPLALATAVDRLDPDILVVACAGNHGDPFLDLEPDDQRKPSWPAALDDVVAVGSARRSAGDAEPGYTLSPFTPPDVAWMDVLTAGENLVSTYFVGTGPAPSNRVFDGWASWSGTSFSAARVTGRVAAVMAQEKVSAWEAFHQIVPPLRKGARAQAPHVAPFLDL